MLMIAPQGQKICLEGLEPPAGTRNKRKTTSFSFHDPKNIIIFQCRLNRDILIYKSPKSKLFVDFYIILAINGKQQRIFGDKLLQLYLLIVMIQQPSNFTKITKALEYFAKVNLYTRRELHGCFSRLYQHRHQLQTYSCIGWLTFMLRFHGGSILK